MPTKSSHQEDRETRRRAKRHAAPPEDPALSYDNDIMEQWLRHYGRHGKAYAESANAPFEYQVMAAREVPSGESWHARIIYTKRTLMYLSLPKETDMDVDVLHWWRLRDRQNQTKTSSGSATGTDALPHLAKMARQYLGRPASSAGVERAFSKAGKLHDDLKAAQDDDTLAHALLAGKNCE